MRPNVNPSTPAHQSIADGAQALANKYGLALSLSHRWNARASGAKEPPRRWFIVELVKSTTGSEVMARIFCTMESTLVAESVAMLQASLIRVGVAAIGAAAVVAVVDDGVEFNDLGELITQ